MSGRKGVNLVSVWIIVIFTVIAVTLVTILMLVHTSIMNQELRYTLREQITVLSDNADLQVMEPIRSEPARRLTAKNGFIELVQILCQSDTADSTAIRTLAGLCAEVNAAISQTNRLDIYFPESRMTVGSEGVRFLDDKKYTVQASNYAFLKGIDPDESGWSRHLFSENGESIPYIVYVRPCPGIFPIDRNPLIVSSVQEEKFHTLLQKSLRILNENDRIFLTDFSGVVWSSVEPAFIGTQLPLAESSLQAVSLQNGEQVLLAESGDATGSFNYVLTHPEKGWMHRDDSTVSLWVIVCVSLLCLGMVFVLRVLLTNYSRPMRRLMHRFAIPEAENGSRLISSPSEHFNQIENALQNMTRDQEEKERFLARNRPALREAWLNCLVSGEASYTAPMPQLELSFSHPYFQTVVLSSYPTEEQERVILSVFPSGSFTAAAFDSREKERVYLFNHGQDEKTVPELLREANRILEETDKSLIFGVGILAVTADMIPASFRCARMALSSRYFDGSSTVCVFDPGASHVKSETALPQLIAELQNMADMIQNRSVEESDKAIDELVLQLTESVPSLSYMRSIMLLAASFLCKSAYDMKSEPEEVYGNDLMNDYYHIDSINEFSDRLKRDTHALSAFLSRESSERNRTVVEYAIHYIRSVNPSELSLQSIADALSISTGHLSRMFHQETGKRLVDFLQEARMQHAARLLEEGKMTNEQICDFVGYSRPQYFSAKFKEYYGLTPNEYRRKRMYERGHAAAENE